jgi:hypothetical protein
VGWNFQKTFNFQKNALFKINRFNDLSTTIDTSIVLPKVPRNLQVPRHFSETILVSIVVFLRLDCDTPIYNGFHHRFRPGLGGISTTTFAHFRPCVPPNGRASAPQYGEPHRTSLGWPCSRLWSRLKPTDLGLGVALDCDTRASPPTSVYEVCNQHASYGDRTIEVTSVWYHSRVA